MTVLFTDPPMSYGLAGETTLKRRKSQLGDGYTARASLGINPSRQTFTLVWNGVTKVQAEYIRNWFADLLGTTTFQWTPEGQDVELSWSADRVSVRDDGYDNWSVSVPIEQEYD